MVHQLDNNSATLITKSLQSNIMQWQQKILHLRSSLTLYHKCTKFYLVPVRDVQPTFVPNVHKSQG